MTTENNYKEYADHFKGEKPIGLCSEDRFYVLSYLTEVKKRSDFAYKNNKSQILDLLNYIQKRVTKITKLDVIDYFKNRLSSERNGKLLKKNTRETYRANLRSFFFHVESMLLGEGIDFNNPVPSKKVFKFEEHAFDITKRSEKTKKVLAIPKLNEVLQYCKKNYYSSTMKKRVFIYFCIEACSGARSSEIRTIKIDDINIKERFFETGFEKNARKSTARTGESLIFFFPKGFVPFLKNYMINIKNKGHKYLFPSNKNKNKFWTMSAIDYYVKTIRQRTGIFFTTHYFRHSLINHLKENRCPKSDRLDLLNHQHADTQGRSYEDDDIKKRRLIYDKYFPYYEIPYF